MRSFSSLKNVGTILTMVTLLVACGEKPTPTAEPPEASFMTVSTGKMAVENELPGRLESYRTAEVRARVPGIILKRAFEEGSYVKQGQLLFQIDPRDYNASIQSAKASLARAEANKVQADLKLKRYKPLVEINAVSKQEFDEAFAAQKQAAADVDAAKSELVKAKLNLEYATVTAPISGRIGRQMVTEGSLVGQNEATLLATIQQIDPIYVNLTQSSTELLKLRQKMQDGTLKNTDKSSLKVVMIMNDGSVYPKAGKLLFSDISVDPTTGELSIRALFPNPDNLALPGMFVRARLEQAVDENAIIVPQQAVQYSNDGRTTVLVINQEEKAEIRNIKTDGSAKGNFWVVTEGLQPGDKVIVEGLQKIRPGMTVRAVPWDDPITKKAKEEQSLQTGNANQAKDRANNNEAPAQPSGSTSEPAPTSSTKTE